MARTARTEFSAKATHAQTRAHNAALVLRALYDLGPISRADIARLTGLTRTSVGELVSDLERDGLAMDVGRGPSTGGKQPTLVALNANSRTIITLDLGERTFTAALANLRGELAGRTSRDLEGRDGDEAVAIVHELIDEVRAAATTPILGIGVGTPGVVDGSGTIRWAVSLDWQDLPLAKLLAVGLAVGALTGIVGIGGGFLIVPALVVLGRVPMKQAVGTSLLVIAMNSVAGFVGYSGSVEVPWRFLAGFTAVSVLGILAGTYLVRFVSPAALKRGFAVFLLVIGAFMLWQNRAALSALSALA